MKLPVRQFITAGSADEKVPAKSTFTPAFVHALRYAKADMHKDGYITGEELGLYLKNVVSEVTSQTPQYGKIQDFELARGDFVFKIGAKNKQKIIAIHSDTSKIYQERISRISKQLGVDEEVAKIFFEEVSNFIRDIQKNLTKIASHSTPKYKKQYLIPDTIQKYFRHIMKSKVQTSSIITSKIRTDSVKTYLKRLSNLSMKYKTVELYFERSNFDYDYGDIEEYYKNGKKEYHFSIYNIWQMFKVCKYDNNICSQNYTKTEFEFHYYYLNDLGDWGFKVNAITVDQVATSYTGKANWNIKDVSN